MRDVARLLGVTKVPRALPVGLHVECEDLTHFPPHPYSEGRFLL